MQPPALLFAGGFFERKERKAWGSSVVSFPQ